MTAGNSCRDEVVSALVALSSRNEKQAFTVREVYAEMLAHGTLYAETTVFKTMQRMKDPSPRRPFVSLQRVGRHGFAFRDTPA